MDRWKRCNIYISKKKCPRCDSGEKDIWQAKDGFVTCMVCHWWGWLRVEKELSDGR